MTILPILLTGSIFIGGGVDRLQTGQDTVKWSDYGRIELTIGVTPKHWNWDVKVRCGHVERLNNDELGWEDDVLNSNYCEAGFSIGR